MSEIIILAVSGDPGGARALIPVLYQLEREGIDFTIVQHRFLHDEAPVNWSRIVPPDEIDERSVFFWLREFNFDALIFTSSVFDYFPLTVARVCKSFSKPVVHLLDSWSSYSKRLETDGKARLIPDIYTVMDQVAFQDAVSEGIPNHILRITGLPSFSNLSEEYRVRNKSSLKGLSIENGLSPEKKTIIFVSEPLDLVVESEKPNSKKAGFDQKIAIKILCKLLYPHWKDFQVGILPHPRENAKALYSVWEKNCNKLCGGIINYPKGRHAIFYADGIIGISSILLYEGWLLGKPILVFPIDGERGKIPSMFKKDGINVLSDSQQRDKIFNHFVEAVKSNHRIIQTDEIKLHSQSAELVSRCVVDILKKDSVGRYQLFL